MAQTCPLCQRPDAQFLLQGRDRVHGLPGIFDLYRCSRCLAIFIHPWLKDGELSFYYPDHYSGYRHSRSLDRKSYKGLRRFVLENRYHYPSLRGGNPSSLKQWAAFFLSFVMAKGAVPYRGDGRFLDVGCGGGSYLYRLKGWGWEVYGVEPSAAGVKQARALGLDVRHGELPEARFPQSYFDVIRLNNVLEHLTDPRGTLREVRRILKPDGIVYITVPNTRSFNFWLFGKNWYGLDAPRHVISYCPRALKFLCGATGFKIVELRFRSGAFNFVRSVRYWLEERGGPRWLARIDWPRSRFIRRSLKPFFFLLDILRLGDIMEATLEKAEPR